MLTPNTLTKQMFQIRQANLTWGPLCAAPHSLPKKMFFRGFVPPPLPHLRWKERELILRYPQDKDIPCHKELTESDQRRVKALLTMFILLASVQRRLLQRFRPETELEHSVGPGRWLRDGYVHGRGGPDHPDTRRFARRTSSVPVRGASRCPRW